MMGKGSIAIFKNNFLPALEAHDWNGMVIFGKCRQ
jgi:regulator of RNase E activity RraA